jgi:hypothetical protein
MFSDSDLTAIYKNPDTSHRIAIEELGIDSRGIFSLGTVRITEDNAAYVSDAAHITVVKSDFPGSLGSYKGSIVKIYDPFSQGEAGSYNLYKIKSQPQSSFGQIMQFELVRHDENSN